MSQRNILLIGMPAVGKSTYGKYLADHLGLRYIDTDDLVEDLAGEKLPDIVRNDGHQLVDELESKALNEVSKQQGLVIATGGSAVYREGITTLANDCLTVHLFARKNTLRKRIGDMEQRGIIFPENMTFDELFEQRMPLYKKLADIEVSTDSSKGNQGQISQHLLQAVEQAIEQRLVDEKWMSVAIDMAKQAELNGEVPIGAVVVVDGEVVGKSGNETISDNDPSAHAEIVAIRQACKHLSNHRLTNATLYVTLEPCIMCAGAIVQARLPRLVFAAKDEKIGAVESAFQMLDSPQLNHRCIVDSGIHSKAAAELLKNFFQKRR